MAVSVNDAGSKLQCYGIILEGNWAFYETVLL